MSTKAANKSRTDAVSIFEQRYIRNNARMRRFIEQERVTAEAAQQIYDLRQEAGLTQKELAQLVGTNTSAISRLEDADFGRHSLSTLLRIGAALGKRVQVRFVAPEEKAPKAR